MQRLHVCPQATSVLLHAMCQGCWQLHLRVQVPCRPTNNIQLRILELRASAGGYLKLTLLDVAGGGALSSVAVRQYGTDVRPVKMSFLSSCCCMAMAMRMRLAGTGIAMLM